MVGPGEVIYTYSYLKNIGIDCKRRWCGDENGFSVFGSFEEARADLLDIKKTVEGDADGLWSAMQIEKIEMLPMTRSNLLILLNKGMEAVVHTSEIMEIIE